MKKKMLALLFAGVFTLGTVSQVEAMPNDHNKWNMIVSSSTGKKICHTVKNIDKRQHSPVYYAYSGNGYAFFVDPIDERVVSASHKQLKNWKTALGKSGEQFEGVFDSKGYLIKVKKVSK